jgi:hypothetical protein
MADTIFDTRANPDVTSTTTSTQNAPSYYTNYLSGLSQAGQTALANPNNVAPLTAMQEQGWAATPGAAAAYKPGLTAAEATAGTAAAGAAPQIQSFMSPYTSNVVDEMARLQQQNVQRNLMPQLKAGFVSTGGLGSTRYANATGQTLADLQSNLTGQQYGALDAGYKAAVNAALNNSQLQNNAARTQGDLAGQEQALGLTGASALTKAGTEQQAYQQSLIDAPLKEATNVAALMRGYTVPGSTTASTTGPMTTNYYQGSPLAQTLGVSSMLGSLYGRPKNSSGILGDVASYFGSSAGSAGRSLSNFFSGGSNISGTSAARDPYTGEPRGSLSGNSAADQESNANFDLPLGVSSDGRGGYVNDYGAAVDVSGNLIGLQDSGYNGAGSIDYNPGASASTGSWQYDENNDPVWVPN